MTCRYLTNESSNRKERKLSEGRDRIGILMKTTKRKKAPRLNPMTFVGLHIPKCAGTSVLDMFLDNVPRHSVYQSTSLIRNWRDEQPQFLDICDYRCLRVVWGHFIHEQMLYYVQNPILITGMRDPAERLTSEARYQVSLHKLQDRPFDVEHWLANQLNPMTWFIINRFPTLADRENLSLTPFEKAKKALSAFHHIYFTENFLRSVKTIFTAIGTSVVEKISNKSAAEEFTIEVDQEKIQFDIELYNWARNKFGSQELDLAAPMPRVLVRFLERPPRPRILEQFLFRAQANEYYAWNALDEVIDDRIAQATRILKEVEYYKRKRSK